MSVISSVTTRKRCAGCAGKFKMLRVWLPSLKPWGTKPG